MADLINLRQVRKARARAEKRAAGDENAARSGRTKAEKQRDKAEAERLIATVEGHRRDPERRGSDE